MSSMAPFAASSNLCNGLSTCGEPQLVEPGATLFRQGEAAKGLYVVKSGKVQLSLADPDGGVTPDRLAQEGCVLGLPATMTGNPYTLTARIEDRSEVVFVEREKALDLFRNDPTLCFEVVEILAQEVSYMRLNAVAVFSTTTVTGRN